MPLAWILMFHFDMGLNGYAHAYTVATVGQCITMYLVIGVWKKQHLQPEKWWYGLGCSDALAKSINWRFVKCTIPMVVQMLADSAGATVYYSLMAGYGERSLASYGVSDALTGTGGSFSLALWTATSIRVGTLLGENDPARARLAARAGIVYSVGLGVLLAGSLYLLRFQLTAFLSPTDTVVQKMMQDVIVPVCLFYLLSSIQYGMWGVLQGQMRVCFVSVAITANTWGFAVPFSYAALQFWGPDSDHAQVAHPHNATVLVSGDGGCGDGDPALPLLLMSWSIVAAMLLCDVMMFAAIVTSDWQKLADEAVAYSASDGGGDDNAKALGLQSWIGSVMTDPRGAADLVMGSRGARGEGITGAQAPMRMSEAGFEVGYALPTRPPNEHHTARNSCIN